MRKLGVTLSTVLIVGIAPVVVAAVDLFTPLLPLEASSGDFMFCTALNVSSTAQTVTVRTMALNGDQSNVSGPASLSPGQGLSLGEGPLPGTSLLRYCQFTVDGSKASAIRAGALIKPANTFYPAQ